MHSLRPSVGRLRKRAGRRREVSRRELGLRAELVVADYLFACGFAILHRNLRQGHLELDVVARSGPLVVIVEVRSRSAGARVGPFQSVDKAKRMRIARAADQLWRTSLCRDPSIKRVRIDVAAVTFDGPRAQIDYAKGAGSL